MKRKNTKRVRKVVDANARKTSIHFTMRMPRDLAKVLKQVARAQKKTAAQVVTEALRIARARWNRNQVTP